MANLLFRIVGCFFLGMLFKEFVINKMENVVSENTFFFIELGINVAFPIVLIILFSIIFWLDAKEQAKTELN